MGISSVQHGTATQTLTPIRSAAKAASQAVAAAARAGATVIEATDHAAKKPLQGRALAALSVGTAAAADTTEQHRAQSARKKVALGLAGGMIAGTAAGTVIGSRVSDRVTAKVLERTLVGVPAGLARNKPIADAVSKGMNHGIVVGVAVAGTLVAAGYLVGKHYEKKQLAQ
jgi:hypothetical protein